MPSCHVNKDLAMKSQLMALTNSEKETRHVTMHRHKHATPREREFTTYLHQGLPVCRQVFLFLHNVGPRAFKTIRMSCRHDGIAPRVHGNKRRLPPNALSFEETRGVVAFIQNYAEEHAIMLLGRVPGYRKTDLQLLPCHTTKYLVWKVYSSVAAQQSGMRCIAYSTFCQLWSPLLSNILPTRPMTDLCAQRHKHAALVQRNSNLSEEEKSQVTVFV